MNFRNEKLQDDTHLRLHNKPFFLGKLPNNNHNDNTISLLTIGGR